MNPFVLVLGLILYGLTILCFWLPYKNNNRLTAKTIGLSLAIIITLTIVGDLDFWTIFIWPFVFVFQVIFIVYWLFKLYGKRKLGTIIASTLAIAFLLLCLSPWISDWLFNKKDVRKILSFHGIKLGDNFRIIQNESGGFRDYYETFTVKLTDKDFSNISQNILGSKSFKGLFVDYKNVPKVSYQNHDTLNYETENFIHQEYYSKQKTKSGTFHFVFNLNKMKKELSYIGSDE